MHFAEKLVQLRKASGLSQEELADRLGVSRQAVSRWEQGSSYPDLPNLQRITEEFGVSADYLIGTNYAAPSPNTAPTSAPSEPSQTAFDFKANRFLIIGFIWIFAAVCFLIAALDSMSIAYVGLALADTLLACFNFVLHFRKKN
jgi:transcriptional regulator with XRE-family HTH domain